MYQFTINDQLFAHVSRRAADAGFPSVEAYVTNMLEQDVDEDADDFSGFFTPERLAAIDHAAAQADAGQVVSLPEASERLRRMMNDER